MALPGVADHLATIAGMLAPMLARFDAAGGLRRIYEAARAAAAIP